VVDAPLALSVDEVRRLRGVLYLCGAPRDDIEDCVQEVQARLLQQQVEPHDRLSWACVVGRNLVRDRARIGLRRDAAERRLRRERRPSRDADVALRVAVARALDTLPDDLREALVLRCYADLSVAQIAASVGVPEGTVKSRLHRAAALMRDALPREEWT
jgi:RNA polymerase sigma-70 factor (ECF subfamily)